MGNLSNEQSQSIRLLIADDDRVLRTTIGKLYTKAGYKVVLAEDGQEAVQYARSQQFDLALIDLDMPGQKGIDVLKDIKRFAPNMPVIIVTGVGAWDTYSKALNESVDQYVSKPVRQDELLLLVSETLKRVHSHGTESRV